MVGFQARSVVEGVFIKALADKDLTARWHKLTPETEYAAVLFVDPLLSVCHEKLSTN
jgi:hypothetical protein